MIGNQRSCNEIFPTRLECDLETNNVINVQVAKKIYYFFVNIIMFFIPILLMTICYSMIVAKLYCSSSPGERLGGVTPQVLLYINSDQSLPLVKHELETILIDEEETTSDPPLTYETQLVLVSLHSAAAPII